MRLHADNGALHRGASRGGATVDPRGAPRVARTGGTSSRGVPGEGIQG